MVNYMANSSSGKLVFYSFCEVINNNYWAWLHDGVYYCAIMIAQEADMQCISDDENREQEQISNGFVWPVCLTGSDNASFVKRFQSKKEMLNWAFQVKSIDIDNDSTFLFYNS